LTEGAVKVAVHRLRKRYGKILRQEIAQTVSGPEAVEEEIQYLFQVLGA
jgi:RNA polymerase sigma-70 factor (ECF subfamily)